jgi:hypothetical protein
MPKTNSDFVSSGTPSNKDIILLIIGGALSSSAGIPDKPENNSGTIKAVPIPLKIAQTKLRTNAVAISKGNRRA